MPSNLSRGVFSPNGHYAVCGAANGYVYAWQAETGTFEVDLGNVEAARRREQRGGSNAGSGGAGGGRTRTDSDDLMGGAFASTRMEDSAIAATPHGGKQILSVDWSVDSRYIASCDEAGTLVLWAND